MSYMNRAFLCLAVLIFALLILASCSLGPQPPKMGTPPFYWQAVNENWPQGDYLKVADQLEQLVKTDSEFTGRARPWRMVLTAGMAEGYMEMADAFEAGGRANSLNPTPFRRNAGELRNMAASRVLQFGETYRSFIKADHSGNVLLAFSYPAGATAPIQELTKIGHGAPMSQAQVDSIRKRAVERGVLRATCAAVGAPDDVAKAQALFQAGKAEVPHDTFDLAMVKMLHDGAKLFARDKLDLPDRLELFCNYALDGLKALQETKETKELAAKIQKTLKSAKK